jgi:hypothetical protein
MTFDPYTNRIPHGLLTEDEKAALEATGGPWKYFWSGEWVPARSPSWSDNMIYRAVRKPLPVPQEGDVWVRPCQEGAAIDAVRARGVNIEIAVASGWRLFREVKA